MSLKRLCVALLTTLPPLLGGCSDEVVTASRGDGGTHPGGGGSVTITLPSPMTLELSDLAAPDEHTVTFELTYDPGGVALTAPASYAIGSDHGGLAVEAATYDTASHTVTLTTSRQKLGVQYQLSIAAPGEPVDGLGGDFPSADTAAFWAQDFGDPQFADYALVADRVEIGDKCVVYVEQGMTALGVAQAIDHFDEQVFPIETAIYTEPSDVDDNGKIVLLGLDGGNHYGGYFSPINTLPDAQTTSMWGVHSNEQDLLYINVAVLGMDDVHVVAHEFSHLLYHARHGFQMEDWSYQNEGLAECAVHAVEGANDYAASYFMLDPDGTIGGGLSLVHWNWGGFDQYSLAYVFWTYLASRLGGVSAYGDLFDVWGHPDDIDDFINAQLGSSFTEIQRDALIAAWVQAPTGPYGFEGMLALPGPNPPSVAPGTTSVALAPFAGTYFKLDGPTVDYPGDQGGDVVYVGINGNGNVDLEAPFDVAGGALVVLNGKFDYDNAAPEQSGPNQPALFPPKAPAEAQFQLAARDHAWLHPPPMHPTRHEALRRWRDHTRR